MKSNIFSKTELIPSTGVYAVFVRIDTERKPLKAMANLGVQPTFNGHSFQVEVHIFDLSSDLYGKPITVFPMAKIRDEIKFDSFEALKDQIQADAAQARLLLA